MLNRIRRRPRPQPRPAFRPQSQPHPYAAGSLLERPDLRVRNLLDDPRLRLAVFGVDSHRDETAA